MAQMDKGKFKEGCQAGNGSFVENADGSFQCNLRGGGVVQCQDTESQCTFTSALDHNLVLDGLAAGEFEVIVPRRGKTHGY